MAASLDASSPGTSWAVFDTSSSSDEEEESMEEQAWAVFDASSSSDDDNEEQTTRATELLGPDLCPFLARLDDTLLDFIFAAAGQALPLCRQQLSAVCSCFQRVLLQQSSCWQRLSLAGLSPQALRTSFSNSVAAAIFSRHGHQLRHVLLDGAENLTSAAMVGLAKHCPNLQSCHVDGCAVRASALQLSRWPRLETLRAAGAIYANGDGDKVALALAAHCPGLTSVGLASLRTDASLVALLQQCQNLTELDLGGCPELPCQEDGLMEALAAPAVQARLTSLKLGGCKQLSSLRGMDACTRLRVLFLGGCISLGAAGPSQLPVLLRGAVSSLELLSLVGCRTLTPDDIYASLSAVRFDKLRKLVLGNTAVDDRSLVAVSWSCPSLESIDLWNCAGVTDGGIGLFRDGMTQESASCLAEVNVRECLNVGGASLLALAGNDDAKSPPCRLRILDIAFAGPGVDDASCVRFLEAARGLELFNVGGPDCSISTRTLCRLPSSITSLDLVECTALRNVAAPLVGLPRLACLSLEGCSGVSASDVVRILRGCSMLKQLSLQDVDAVGDGVLVEAFDGTATTACRLEHVVLKGCRGVSGKGASAVLRASAKLLYLGMGHGGLHPIVMADILEEARMRRPACRVEYAYAE